MAVTGVSIGNAGSFTGNTIRNMTTSVGNGTDVNSGMMALVLTIGVAKALNIKGTVTSSGNFTIPGKVEFSGTTQTIPAGAYAEMEISGSGTKSLAGAVNISSALTLTSGFVELGAYNMSIGSAGSLTGGNDTSFILISGAGSLKQQGIGAGGRTGSVSFPVGTGASFTPLFINNTV